MLVVVESVVRCLRELTIADELRAGVGVQGIQHVLPVGRAGHLAVLAPLGCKRRGDECALHDGFLITRRVGSATCI